MVTRMTRVLERQPSGSALSNWWQPEGRPEVILMAYWGGKLSRMMSSRLSIGASSTFVR